MVIDYINHYFLLRVLGVEPLKYCTDPSPETFKGFN